MFFLFFLLDPPGSSHAREREGTKLLRKVRSMETLTVSLKTCGFGSARVAAGTRFQAKVSRGRQLRSHLAGRRTFGRSSAGAIDLVLEWCRVGAARGMNLCSGSGARRCMSRCITARAATPRRCAIARDCSLTPSVCQTHVISALRLYDI